MKTNKDLVKDESTFDGLSLDFDALFEFSKLLNSSLDLRFILDHILLSTMGKMIISKGCILLQKNAQDFSIEALKGLPPALIYSQFQMNNLPNEIFYLKDLDKRTHKWVKEFLGMQLTIGIPVYTKDKTIAVIFFSEKLTKQPFNTKDLYFLKVLSNTASTSIENSMIVSELQKLNKDLDGKIQQLNTLFDLSKEFGILFDNNKIIRLLSYSIMGQLGIQKYAILIREEDTLKLSISRIPGLDNHIEKLNDLLSLTSPGLINSFKSKSVKGCINLLKEHEVKAIVPLQFKNENKGIVLLCDKLNKEEYKNTDTEFLFSLGNLAILSLENARLFKETLEMQRLEEEIQIAKEIQQGLLPKITPTIKNYDIGTLNIPSKQVGGDYFDIIKKSDDRFIFAIADVSGKGIPASLLMSNLQATIHAYAPMFGSLWEITGKINDIIFENTDMSKFITFFWGILNTEENSFSYVNAGHNPPMLIHSNKEVEYLESGGIILGVTPTSIPYIEGKVFLKKGDLLFCYTDGVTESMNSKGEEFTEKRLLKLLLDKKDESCKTLINSLHNEVLNHAGGIQQYDDLTVIAIKSL
jgi:phosphoserine phosphatase RsbU/P